MNIAGKPRSADTDRPDACTQHASEADMPRWGRVALVVFACLSFGACAAEDRVCALAECEASP